MSEAGAERAEGDLCKTVVRRWVRGKYNGTLQRYCPIEERQQGRDHLSEGLCLYVERVIEGRGRGKGR